MKPKDVATETAARSSYYPTTLWTQIAQARESAAESEQAWQLLTSRYQRPIHAQIEKHIQQDAENLTAEFMGRVFVPSLIPKADRAKGRFRHLLATALRHFISSELRKRYARKRGGAENDLPLDAVDLDRLPAHAEQTDTFYQELDRALAAEVFNRAYERTKRAFVEKNPDPRAAEGFELLMAKTEAPPPPDQAIAQRLQISVPAIKTRRHRLRISLREAIRAEVADLVSPAEVEEEMNYLMSLI